MRLCLLVLAPFASANVAGTVVLPPLYQKAGGDITDERSILPLSVLLSVSLPLHILPRETFGSLYPTTPQQTTESSGKSWRHSGACHGLLCKGCSVKCKKSFWCKSFGCKRCLV